MKMLKKYKLTKIEDLKKELRIEDETELQKLYELKEKTSNSSLENKLEFSEIEETFSGKISGPKLSYSDFGKKYGIALFDICYDPTGNRGMNGCAYNSQVQLINLDEMKNLSTENFHYRDVGNSPFMHSIYFHEGKILKEEENRVTYGIKSNNSLEIREFNEETNEEKTIEDINLKRNKKNKEKLENFNKTFSEFDKNSIENFFKETNYFTSVEQIDKDHSLVMLYDPYADTGSRHAKTKLVIRNTGVIDLDYHSPEFPVKQITHDFRIKDSTLFSDEKNNLTLRYSIEEVGMRNVLDIPLGKTTHEIKIPGKKLKLKPNNNLRLEGIIEKNKEDWLNPGNINPIAMGGVEEGNYPYSINKLMNNKQAYVSVVNVIDCERYDRGNLVDPQIKASIYKVKEINSKKPSIERIFSKTFERTDVNPTDGRFLEVEKTGDDYEYNPKTKLTFAKIPKLEINGNYLKLSYNLIDSDGEKTKEIKINVENENAKKI